MSSDSPAPAEDATAAGDSDPQTDNTTPATPVAESDAALEHAAPEEAPAKVAAESEPEAVSEEVPTEAAGPPRPKIQVGSRRGDPAEKLKSSKPLLVRQDRPIAEEAALAAAAVTETQANSLETSLPIEDVAPIPKAVPKPTRRDPLSADLEAELNEAMGDVSLDEIAEGGAADRASQLLELETRIRAGVIRIHGDNIFFGLSGRNEGVCSVRQFKEPPAIGTQMDVVLKKYNADDGLYEVLVPGASIEVADWSDLTEGGVVEVRITGANTGGLECMVSNIRGFIPSSQIGLFRVENFADYINQKLLCVVTEVNRRKKNLVLSHRALLEREREEARKKLLEQLTPGETCEGVVRSIRDFGAFVDLGGIDGLIHISQLSWDRVNHPSEVLEEGQKVRVKIEKINAQTGKIGLSYRDLLDHPWTDIEQKIPAGSTVKGPVTRVANFGAFVKLAPGVEGLIHISELAHQHIRSVGDVLKEGEEVEVKVLSVDSEAQRIALSLKATLPEPEGEAEGPEQDEPERDMAVAKRKGPLKGGFDRPSGGAEFGLKW
jgi:small subunit ribosomal protein S1